MTTTSQSSNGGAGANVETGSRDSRIVYVEEINTDGSVQYKMEVDTVTGAVSHAADDEDGVGHDSSNVPHNAQGYQLVDMSPFEREYKEPANFNWKKLDRKTREYYLTLNEEIEGYREMQKLNTAGDPDAQKNIILENGRIDKIVTYVSGAGNVILLGSLIVAFAFSGAISLIASLMDAALDNLSIVLILTTTYLRRKVDPYKYPQGKERLEPVGVMIFSCVMGTASIILIVESVQKLATDPYNPPDASIISILLIAADLGMKLLLFVLCQRYAKRSGVAAALAQDHRNDLVLNSTALVCTIVGTGDKEA